MKNYWDTSLKQFLKSTFLYVASLSIVAAFNLTYAQDRIGNGGSGTEIELATEQAILEQTANKIKIFFLKNKELQNYFSEFHTSDLIKKIDQLRIEVTNETLIDRHNKVRTCLNFSDSELIQCNYSELQNTKHTPKTIFVLTLHEILGLLKIKETSPDNINIIDGYRISKKLAPFVTQTNNYDLKLPEKKSSLGANITLLSGKEVAESESLLDSNSMSECNKQSEFLKKQTQLRFFREQPHLRASDYINFYCVSKEGSRTATYTLTIWRLSPSFKVEKHQMRAQTTASHLEINNKISDKVLLSRLAPMHAAHEDYMQKLSERENFVTLSQNIKEIKQGKSVCRLSKGTSILDRYCYEKTWDYIEISLR